MRNLACILAMTLCAPAWSQVSIEQLGDTNSVYIEQVGRHTVTILGSGNSSTTSILQQGSVHNQATVDTTGSNQNITIEQRNTGNASRAFDLRVNGNGANVQVVQTNPGQGAGQADQGSMNITCPVACPQGQYQYIRR